MKKKRTLMICMSILLTVLLLTSCNRPRVRETKFFRWELHNESAAIAGLTEKGKEQEFLVIPSEIEGKRVKLRTPSGGWFGIPPGRGSIESKNLRRIYMSPGFGSEHGFFRNMPKLTHIFELETFSPRASLQFTETIRFQEQTIYFVSNHLWTTFHNQPLFDGITIPRSVMPIPAFQARVANVEFIYNFDDAPNNGVFFIDDWQDKLIRFRPNDPMREGYTFKGWFREPEGINKWDFESDIVEVEYTFEVTRLYASWIEN